MRPEAMARATPPRSRLVPLLLAALMLAPAAEAQQATPLPPMMVYADGQKAKIRGIIIAREGDDIKVREGDRAVHIVTLREGTKIATPSGLFKLDRTRRDASNLIPGLMLTIEGRGRADGKLEADEIKFSATSLRTAQQINVGQEVLEGRVAANADSIARAKQRVRDSLARLDLRISRVRDSVARLDQRVSNLDDYDEKFVTVVNFATGSAVLSEDAKRALDNAVTRAVSLKGYMVEVTGYADTTGTDAVNRPLSERRAQSVVAYVTEVQRVPLRRILNPTGHGTAAAVATNTTADGRAMNRRAQVRVLVNRALANDGSPR